VLTKPAVAIPTGQNALRGGNKRPVVGKVLYSVGASDFVNNKKAISQADLGASLRELRSIPLLLTSQGDPSALLNSMVASTQDLTNNNQNAASAIPILSSLPSTGVSPSILGDLGNIIQLPNTAPDETPSLSNLDLQSGIVNYVTGFLQTNFNILTSLSQIFALATSEFPDTESTGLCTLDLPLNSVSTMTTQVNALNSYVQQIILLLRTSPLSVLERV
jgi:hypothetical protein